MFMLKVVSMVEVVVGVVGPHVHAYGCEHGGGGCGCGWLAWWCDGECMVVVVVMKVVLGIWWWWLCWVYCMVVVVV